MTEYKNLTPKVRAELDEGFDSLLKEIKSCEKNILTEMQYETVLAAKTLIHLLPDGYLLPLKEEKK